MRKFFKFIGIFLAGIIAVTWLYLQFAYPSYTVRYRLSVDVETPAGTRTGTGVLEASGEFHMQPWAEILPFTSKARGEAIPIDLGEGKILFITLRRDSVRRRSSSAIGIIFTDLKRSKERYPRPQRVDRWTRAAKSPLRHLEPDQLPLLVTFSDINDPTSVKRVEPDDLEKHFGAGVRFREITLEIVNDPITTGRIEVVLGWLSKIKGRIKPTNKQYERDLLPEEKLYQIHFRKL